MSIRKLTAEQLASIFPNLSQDNHQVTSDETTLYNCVAWATGENTSWVDFYLTPEGEIADDQSSASYIEYFRGKGFEVCDDGGFQPDLEKIALYENRRHEFTHVALQLANGHWTSKLGDWEDIEHFTLESLEGTGKDTYGSAVVYMCRPRTR